MVFIAVTDMPAAGQRIAVEAASPFVWHLARQQIGASVAVREPNLSKLVHEGRELGIPDQEVAPLESVTP